LRIQYGVQSQNISPPLSISRRWSQFTGSSKAYASTLIKKLVNEKYSGGGIREHILKMSNTTPKLKPMDLGLKDEFLIYFDCCFFAQRI
jgi:hypothetical protein